MQMILAVFGWPLTLAVIGLFLLVPFALLAGGILYFKAIPRCPDCHCRVEDETTVCPRCGHQLLPV